MTVKTRTALDIATLKRGYEEWDIEALAALYDDELEYVQIDRDHPPSSPRVSRGKESARGMWEHCASAGVQATVENAVADGDRAAATITCRFPNGRTVVGNSTYELRDGVIVRELCVASGDS